MRLEHIRPPEVLPEPLIDRFDRRTVTLVAVVVAASILAIAAALVMFGRSDSGGIESGSASGAEAVDDPSDPDGDPQALTGAGAITASTPVGQTTASASDTTISITTASTTIPSTTASTTTPSTTVSTTAPPTTASTTSIETSTTPSSAPSTTASTEPSTTETSTTVAPSTTDTVTSTTAPSSLPPTSATTNPPSTSGDGVFQQAVLDLTNQARSQNGCGALRLDPQLNEAADGHSEDMLARNYFSHSDPEGNGPGVRVDATGYPHRGWGENIAAGYGSAEAVVDGWMNSPGHRANILNCAYDELGVGYAASGGGGPYWTQVFATRR